jgi:hypothetical protein
MASMHDQPAAGDASGATEPGMWLPWQRLTAAMAGELPPCPHGGSVTRDGDPEMDTIGLGVVALRYAALGLAVFPLKPGTKQPATEHGFLDASMRPGRSPAGGPATGR